MSGAEELLRDAGDMLLVQVDELTDRLVAAIRGDAATRELVDEPGLAGLVRSETAAVLRELVAAVTSGDEPLRPPETRHVARLAARNGTPERAVLDAYRAGHRMLEAALIDAIPDTADTAAALAAVRLAGQRLFAQIEQLDALVRAEYREELDAIKRARGPRQLSAVRAVLRGQQPARLDFYDVRAEHVAVAATGAASARVLHGLTSRLGRPSCVVWPDAHLGWAWISGADADAVEAAADAAADTGCRVGLGEAAGGPDGFRHSHAEARMALRVAEHRALRVVRFSDAAPEAIALADVEASRTLIRRQLGALAQPGRQADSARRTLTAYLGCGSNARAAARLLGVSSRTVAYRLQRARELLPAASDPSALETALALRLHETLGLDEPGDTPGLR